MDSGPEPGAVCMPPKCALLAFNRETVRVALSRSDRALSHELRPVSPRSSQLSDSMPASPDEKFRDMTLKTFVRKYSEKITTP